jgi:hypothetical protein
MSRERPPENLHGRIVTSLAPVLGAFMLLKSLAGSSPAARRTWQESALHKPPIADNRAVVADFSGATEYRRRQSPRIASFSFLVT